MKRRQALSRSGSKRLFSATARPHTKNTYQGTPPRGGYRI